MVMPAARRKAKYASKFDPAVIEMRLIAVKNAAIANADDAFDDIYAMEAAAQTVMNEEGTITSDRPKYYNFCREIFKAVRNGVADPALTSMVTLELGPKYEALGCTASTLIALALGVFSITLPP